MNLLAFHHHFNPTHFTNHRLHSSSSIPLPKFKKPLFSTYPCRGSSSSPNIVRFELKNHPDTGHSDEISKLIRRIRALSGSLRWFKEKADGTPFYKSVANNLDSVFSNEIVKIVMRIMGWMRNKKKNEEEEVWDETLLSLFDEAVKELNKVCNELLNEEEDISDQPSSENLARSPEVFEKMLDLYELISFGDHGLLS